MLKKMKMTFAAMPLLLLAVANPISAATLYHPGDDEGGCGASQYDDYNGSTNTYTIFTVPAIANGASVGVSGIQSYNGGPYQYGASATFECSNGVLSTSNPYDFEISWVGN